MPAGTEMWMAIFLVILLKDENYLSNQQKIRPKSDKLLVISYITTCEHFFDDFFYCNLCKDVFQRIYFFNCFKFYWLLKILKVWPLYMYIFLIMRHKFRYSEWIFFFTAKYILYVFIYLFFNLNIGWLWRDMWSRCQCLLNALTFYKYYSIR